MGRTRELGPPMNTVGRFCRHREQLSEDVPLGRVGEPEEFAAAAAFLASERAS